MQNTVISSPVAKHEKDHFPRNKVEPQRHTKSQQPQRNRLRTVGNDTISMIF